MELKKKSSPLKLLSQSQPNFAEMILGWSPFTIVSVSAVLYPRWPPLLKSSSLCLNSSNLGTFWLKIEQFWPFEEISIFSNGGHLGYRTALTDTILKGDHQRIISAKFGWDWLSSFRGDFFFYFIPPFFLICIIGHNRQKFKVHKKSCNMC